MRRAAAALLAGWLAVSCLTGCAGKPQEPPTEPPLSTLPPETVPATEPIPTNPPELPKCLPELSEVLPDNRMYLLGNSLDYVELYNPHETPLALDGFALSTGTGDRLPLDGLTVPEGSFLPVSLPADSPVQLSESGGTVYLLYGAETVASLTFPASQKGEAFDANGVCLFPTPGYANTEEGYCAYLKSQPLPELMLSEAMAGNGSYYQQPGYLFYDWVELKNNSASPVNLSGCHLSHRWEDTPRFYLPDVTLAPGETYMVLCSGDPSLGKNHAPFGISAGDTLYLYRDGTFLDCLHLPENLKYNESYGRCGCLPSYQAKPTPGKDNGEGYLLGISSPEVDVAPGLYDEPVTVTLSGPGTIYYTLSGARPNTSSTRYDGPITVSGVTTLRAICVQDGRTSPPVDYTYVVGKTHDLPVLVVSLPSSSLWGGEGILSNVEASYEYEGIMTLFENGEKAFSSPMGLRLHGNDSRFGAKKNFQVRFRGKYGASKLKYPLFDSRDIDEFDSLLLKGGSEDWGTAMLRDELSTYLVDGTTALYTQAMRPVVLYLGGEYWGVYHIRERFSDEYVASHLGVTPESADLVYSSGGYSQAGSARDFDAIKSYVSSHDMRDTENYAYLCQRIDVTSLMDWYICRTYLEDTDTANIRRCRSVEADGKWHWMFFDLDWSFYSRGGQPFTHIVEDPNGDYKLIHAVLASRAGQDAFLRRYAYLLETVLNPEYINRCIDELIAPIESEMVRDRPRWNRSVSAWESHVQDLRDFPVNRNRRLLRDVQQYFGLSDRQMDDYFGDLWK